MSEYEQQKGGSVTFVDRSGQPRTEDDIKEALQEVNRQLASGLHEPRFMVLLPTIRDSLKELLHIRRVLREHQEKKNGDHK